MEKHLIIVIFSPQNSI